VSGRSGRVRPPLRPVALVALAVLAVVTVAALANREGPEQKAAASVGSGNAQSSGASSHAARSTQPLSIGAGSPPPSAPSSARPATAHPVGPGVVLIADRGNGRLLMVDRSGRVLWRFPVAGSLPRGQRFAADDAFIAPDGRTIVANDEGHQVIDRIDIATRRVTWQYGHYDQPGARLGWLHTPDDAYPLANGDVVVADIRNCRILEVNAAKRIVREYGHAGRCVHDPPRAFDEPNGDTPLPDGGLLITEIRGSRVVRLSASGRVVFDIHVRVRYPSDAQLDANGNVVVVDYSNPGAVVRVDGRGRELWRYQPTSGAGRLDHPSLAVPLPDGMIVLNDDFRHRIVEIDPSTNTIVWQYGRTDRASGRLGGLNAPDGIDPVPAELTLP
jgi:outer membrane protein assembly factor BamB